MANIFYEGTNRAQYDAPYVDTGLTNIQYGAHFHEKIEIIFMLEGTVHLTVEGKCMVLQQGELALVRPFQIHSLSTPTQSRMYLFKILSPFFDFSAVERADAMLTPGEPEYASIYESVQMLIREHALPEDAPLKRLALRSATDQLLVRLATAPRRTSRTKGAHGGSRPGHRAAEGAERLFGRSLPRGDLSGGCGGGLSYVPLLFRPFFQAHHRHHVPALSEWLSVGEGTGKMAKGVAGVVGCHGKGIVCTS